ncbi:hypothetical protein [Rugamonas apoptosis]|uniref:Uncharacterized protein n=1 Tax=Rugamonas apoptosis TaxID=2758570 RepID=A0A7W2F765_9BURK|nr:hypothetical protein [Rugamonas apoptosis]MBA5686334.1 hypothetical protein [Rugamonas apoptosis]
MKHNLAVDVIKTKSISAKIEKSAVIALTVGEAFFGISQFLGDFSSLQISGVLVLATGICVLKGWRVINDLAER